MNKLYYGDCLTIMNDWPDSCVDLIYLDPPFNSNRQYNAIYKDETGRPLPDQVEAFCDMWELDEERERAIRAMPLLMREAGIDDSIAEFWRLWMRALRDTQPRLLAYLSYMAERLIVMRRILKPAGSLYLHCDPTASHYIKALLDAVFGHQNFRNEIIWQRTGARGVGVRYTIRCSSTPEATSIPGIVLIRRMIRDTLIGSIGIRTNTERIRSSHLQARERDREILVGHGAVLTPRT